MNNHKYYKFIYLDYVNNTLVYTTDYEKALIKIIQMEPLTNLTLQEEFIPYHFCDIDINHENFKKLKKMINNHMREIKKNIKSKSECTKLNINHNILEWLNQNIYYFIENEFYPFLHDVKRYVKYICHKFYNTLTYILTHSRYSNIENDIDIFSKTTFYRVYLDTKYTFNKYNMNINNIIPSVGNLLLPCKFYDLEDRRTYIPQYLKTIKHALDKIKYTKYNKTVKLIRIIINLIFSSINVIIALIYIILCIIVNKRNKIGYIVYNYEH